MCHYITLIAPTEDAVALSAIMRRHGRDARAIDNPSLGKRLRPGERQYLTARGNCDCGTVLGQQLDPAEEARSLKRNVARLRRARWSPARIARWVEGRRNPEDLRQASPEIDMWAAVLGDLAKDLRLSHAGLFVHAYSGGLDDEDLSATRRTVLRDDDRREALLALLEDELLVFRFDA